MKYWSCIILSNTDPLIFILNSEHSLSCTCTIALQDTGALLVLQDPCMTSALCNTGPAWFLCNSGPAWFLSNSGPAWFLYKTGPAALLCNKGHTELLWKDSEEHDRRWDSLWIFYPFTKLRYEMIVWSHVKTLFQSMGLKVTISKSLSVCTPARCQQNANNSTSD